MAVYTGAMVIVLKADVRAESPEVKQIVALAESFPGVSTRVHVVQGATRSLTEVYLLGATHAVPTTPFEEFERRREGRAHHREVPHHRPPRRTGSRRSASSTTASLLAGHACTSSPGCAPSTRARTSSATFARAAPSTASSPRAPGAYKPRTSPYDFQGHGAACLPYVFELAGKYGIRVIAMEVTHESHIDEIRDGARGDRQRRPA